MHTVKLKCINDKVMSSQQEKTINIISWNETPHSVYRMTQKEDDLTENQGR